jgi:hypothetical protein
MARLRWCCGIELSAQRVKLVGVALYVVRKCDWRWCWKLDLHLLEQIQTSSQACYNGIKTI